LVLTLFGNLVVLPEGAGESPPLSQSNWKGKPMLSGYKTYIVAAMLLIAVAVEKGLGIDVPGMTVTDDWMVLVLNSMGLGTLRAALGKIEA
jgi:hypothetical protein